MPATLSVTEDSADLVRVRLEGHLDAWTVGRVWNEAITRLTRPKGRRVVVDAGAVTYCDTAGAALLADLDAELERGNGSLEIHDFPPAFQPILDLLRRQKPAASGPPPTLCSVPEYVGRQTVSIARDVVQLVGYVGEVVQALAVAVVHPGSVRWSDALRTMQAAGVNAFPVVFLISFLLGLILAYQSADTFHQYGADVLLANLLGLSLVRELGPLMTAIVLTARSGSSFAAEIGTMKVNEEVDALTTMGLDPVRFLVTPRVIAAVLMTPLLAMFANLAGLAGGAVVWVLSLRLPLLVYRHQLVEALKLKDLLGGLGKALVFGILVAAIGCIRGLETRGGAIAVGQSTTRAVVSGIVLIALADAVFAILFFHLGI